MSKYLVLLYISTKSTVQYSVHPIKERKSIMTTVLVILILIIVVLQWFLTRSLIDYAEETEKIAHNLHNKISILISDLNQIQIMVKDLNNNETIIDELDSNLDKAVAKIVKLEYAIEEGDPKKTRKSSRRAPIRGRGKKKK